MVEFDELRHLWQNQAQPDTPLALDGRAMTEVLRKFHRRQTVINSFRAALLVFLLVWGPTHAHHVTAIVGIVLMVIGLSIYLYVDWKNQISIARLDFTRPSVEFVEDGIQRLNDMRDPFRKAFWIFIGSAVIGLNLIRLVPPYPIPWYRHVINHVTATAVPFFAYAFGLWIRNKRFDTECRAIMEKLVSMHDAMRERTL